MKIKEQFFLSLGLGFCKKNFSGKVFSNAFFKGVFYVNASEV